MNREPKRIEASPFVICSPRLPSPRGCMTVWSFLSFPPANPERVTA